MVRRGEICARSSSMKIGIIGAGAIGGTLARGWAALGHQVAVANSRGPRSLAGLAALAGVEAVEVGEVVAGREAIVVSIPMTAVANLPAGLFAQASAAVVIDTCNYYPRERDGRIAEIEEGLAESRWVERRIGHPVVKTFNTIDSSYLSGMGMPPGSPGRIALPVAGDEAGAKATTMALVDELGFEPVDAGSIDESWRQQPGAPAYEVEIGAEDLRAALAAASPERPERQRATAASPGTFAEPR